MASTTSSSESQPPVVTVSLPPSQIPTFLHNKLHRLLPYSLPLYRRCQFLLYELGKNAQQDRTSPEPGQPEVWIALSNPDGRHNSASDHWLESWLDMPEAECSDSTKPSKNSQDEWLACYIDLREPGQTQVWVFGSWEATVTPKIMSTDEKATHNPTSTQIALGQALFHHLRTHHIPTLSTEPSSQYLTMKQAGKIVSDPFRRSKVLFGAIAEASWWLLEDRIIKGSESVEPTNDEDSTKSKTTLICREDRPYLKYLLSLPLAPPPLTRPDGKQSVAAQIKPSALTQKQLQTVLDRSNIPRSIETLQSLVSICYCIHTGWPAIAWGILSKDASIGSLHTEPGYRGQGFAQAISRELIKRQGLKFRTEFGSGDVQGKKSEDGEEPVFPEETEVMWAHVDISPDNKPSRKVFERLGAEVGWRVGWVEVEVGEK